MKCKKFWSVLLTLALVCSMFCGLSTNIAQTSAASYQLANGDYYFRGVNTGKVICADNYGNDILIGNRDSYGGEWEMLTVVNNSDGTVSLRSGANGKYITVVNDENQQLLARGSAIDTWEKFYVEQITETQFALRSYINGKYVTVNENDSNRLYATASDVQAWEVFSIYTTSGQQVTGSAAPTTTTTTTRATTTTTTRATTTTTTRATTTTTTAAAQSGTGIVSGGSYYLKGVNTGKVVCADNYGNDILIANRDSYGGEWEMLTIIVNSDGTVSFRSGANSKYITMVNDENQQLLARGSAIDAWEKFYLERVTDTQYAIKSAVNNKYVTVNENDSNRLYATASAVQAWEVFNIYTTSGQQVSGAGSSAPTGGNGGNSGGSGNNSGSFRVVGYFPNWYGDVTGSIDWSKLTHTNYSFAIPTSSGGIMALDNTSLVTKLISVAHSNGVEVGLAVGGWSYNGAILQSTFEQATDTAWERTNLVNSIMSIVNQYGFDGVDVDWEYPTSATAAQFEAFMTELNNALDARGKWLSIAVMGGVDTNGNALSSAYAYSSTVLNMVDWVNVMAYDGNEGSGHSPYSFAVNCGNFWINTRGVPKSKVNVGVPFYERPNWAAYSDIVAANSANAYSDSAWINGTQVHYNGLNTMASKTVWACQNAGGVMIWEITQDTSNSSLSLLNCIANNVRNFYPNYK